MLSNQASTLTTRDAECIGYYKAKNICQSFILIG